jgi:F0F1-type ATP synthase membrane subunit b/b'
MENINIFIIISVLCLFFSILSTIIGLVALVKVIAAEKSTHTMTYMPVDEEIEKANEEVMRQWATKESAIAKDQELFREDLENEMPDFFPDEDEKEIISL